MDDEEELKIHCPKCNKELDLNDENIAKWYDDDFDEEEGTHLWDIAIECPYCKYGWWEELWA